MSVTEGNENCTKGDEKDKAITLITPLIKLFQGNTAIRIKNIH